MTETFPNEHDQLERARQRDESAFAALVDTYTPMVYRVVRRMVTDHMEAESIVQETFWRFWNLLPRYDADRPLLPYLVTIASNLARDHYRREHWIEDVDADDLPESRRSDDFDFEQRLDHKQALESLAEAVESLPFAYRAVVSLRYDAEMSYEDIAATLALPLNTVRTHLRRAKQVLREKLEESDHG